MYIVIYLYVYCREYLNSVVNIHKTCIINNTRQLISNSVYFLLILEIYNYIQFDMTVKYNDKI